MSREEPMSNHDHDEQDERLEPPPDSGTERARKRADDAAADEFENEEERRFFSMPPEEPAEHALPSLEPVVAETDHGEHVGPEPTAAERQWLARADARRARLQRWVGLAIVAGAVAFVVAGADRYLAAKNDAASHFTPAVLPVADPTPQPKKNDDRTALVDARGIDGAPSSTSVPVAVPSAIPSNTSAPVAAASVTPSATPLPSVMSSAPRVPPSSAAPAPALAASGRPGPAPSVVAGEADAAGLREKARSLLATGHSRDGVAFARAAVESDPADARSYVLLGAGLQDLGDWGGARDVFHECTLKATRGPSGACQYFARR
jgi:hypothetical protein